MELPFKNSAEQSNACTFSTLELKILRSSLLNWQGDLSALDMDLLKIDEDAFNKMYKDLKRKININLRGSLIKAQQANSKYLLEV